MVNPKKVPKVACHLEYPFGMVGETQLLLVNLLKYGRREFQIEGILIDTEE